MANTITKQTLVDGSRNLVIKVHIVGDGSGDESVASIVDASAFNTSDIKIMDIKASLNGFSINLIWDATANVDAITLAEDMDYLCFHDFGGLINNASTGKTGDILMQTVGLGAGDEGTFTLNMKKKNAV